MRWLTSIAAVVVAAGWATLADAQVVEKKALTLEGARQVIATAIGEARRVKAPGGVFAVVDDGGNLMALERLDGTFAAGANISIGKARTAALFKRPTRAFEEIIKNGRTAMVALTDFTPLQGGVPIVVGDVVVGAIGVSGAASAQQDEELALAGAAAAKALTLGSGGAETSRAVTFIDRQMVTAGFEKGKVLVSMGNYMIHASHREKDGIAEIHTLDTDLIYVLDGAATFVTGGTVPDAKPIEPNELPGLGHRRRGEPPRGEGRRGGGARGRPAHVHRGAGPAELLRGEGPLRRATAAAEGGRDESPMAVPCCRRQPDPGR